MQKIKKCFAIFSLLVFIFPLVEIELHNFSHINDVHCTAVNGHFHQGEHHCILCDYSNDFSATPTVHHPDLVLSELRVLNFYFPSNTYLHSKEDFQSLRAPPIQL